MTDLGKVVEEVLLAHGQVLQATQGHSIADVADRIAEAVRAAVLAEPVSEAEVKAACQAIIEGYVRRGEIEYQDGEQYVDGAMEDAAAALKAARESKTGCAGCKSSLATCPDDCPCTTPEICHPEEPAGLDKKEQSVSSAGEQPARMQNYRERPVVIQAAQWTSGLPADQLPGVCIDSCAAAAHIHTLEGIRIVSRLDWVIRGVKGEYYPCKPDVFAATYEEMDAQVDTMPADAVQRDADGWALHAALESTVREQQAAHPERIYTWDYTAAAAELRERWEAELLSDQAVERAAQAIYAVTCGVKPWDPGTARVLDVNAARVALRAALGREKE